MEEYKDIARFLRTNHRISWRKAISVVGYDFVDRFIAAGNLSSRTAEAISLMVKDAKNAG